MRPSPTVCKGLFSSPSRFVGAYEDDSLLIDHAWPALSDPMASVQKMGEHSAMSRHHFVLGFRVPAQRVAVGVRLDDWSHVVDLATVALATYFGKPFEGHGLIESGLGFHLPRLSASVTPYPSFPTYNDEPRVDVGFALNFERSDWLIRWLTSDTDTMRAVSSAGKYYLRALRTFGYDATSAYVDLVMAGEILSDRYVMTDEARYDAALLAVFGKLDTADANLVKGRLFQVRRKFAAGLASKLNKGFFARTEAKPSFAPIASLKESEIEKRLKAAYDVRSQYVHTGRTFGLTFHSMSDLRNEIQIGKPITGSPKLDKALALAPTFLGLERVIRFGLLRTARDEIGLAHPDLDDDKPTSAVAAGGEAPAGPSSVENVDTRTQEGGNLF
jgi:hypothetical protein